VALSVEPGQEEEPAKNGKPAQEAKPGWIKLESGRWTYIAKEIDGKFPDWKQVMPETNGQWTRVQLSDEAMKQLLLVIPSLPGDDSLNRPVRLRVQSQQLSVEGQNRDDDTWTSIPIQNVKVTGKPVTVALNRTYLTNALRFGLNELEVEDTLSPVVFSKGGKKLVVMPINLDGPGRIRVSPQPQATSEATPPAAEQNQPSAQPEAQQEERTAPMPRTARATAPEPMTTFQPVETHATNANGNGNGNGSAVKSLVDHVEQIKENLKNVIRDLTAVVDTVKAAEKEKRTTDKEIDAIRTKLRQIQNVTI
jgi:hypothetical protein